MKHRWSLTLYAGLRCFMIGRTGFDTWSRAEMGSTIWIWALVFWYNGRMLRLGQRLTRGS